MLFMAFSWRLPTAGSPGLGADVHRISFSLKRKGMQGSHGAMHVCLHDDGFCFVR